MRIGAELKGVYVRWVIGYYDGPLSGICEYDGKIYYFECCGEEDLVRIDWVTREVEDMGYDRFFNVRKIPRRRVALEYIRHGMFNLLVRRIYTKWSRWLWYGIRESHTPEYDDCETIGWCADDKEFFKKQEKRPTQWWLFRR